LVFPPLFSLFLLCFLFRFLLYASIVFHVSQFVHIFPSSVFVTNSSTRSFCSLPSWTILLLLFHLFLPSVIYFVLYMFLVNSYTSLILFIFIIHWPPLWSSGQSSWLQIRRHGFDSRHYQKKK
jgi:hypothetical protein